MCRVIWIDDYVFNSENETYFKMIKDQLKNDIDIKLSDNIEEGIDYINNTVKAVVITSGRTG